MQCQCVTINPFMNGEIRKYYFEIWTDTAKFLLLNLAPLLSRDIICDVGCFSNSISEPWSSVFFWQELLDMYFSLTRLTICLVIRLFFPTVILIDILEEMCGHLLFPTEILEKLLIISIKFTCWKKQKTDGFFFRNSENSNLNSCQKIITGSGVNCYALCKIPMQLNIRYSHPIWSAW